MAIESFGYQPGFHRTDLARGLAEGNQATLLQHIQKRTATISILSLGHVGLPLARAFVVQRFRVLSLDIDARRIEALNRGESYLSHFPATAIQTIQAARFEATMQFERLREADVILICVPTPLTKAREPDLTRVKDAASAIARCLRTGQLVVLESTTYPGRTRDEVLPILAKVGLQAGRDFFLAFSPNGKMPVIQLIPARTSQKWWVALMPLA